MYDDSKVMEEICNEKIQVPHLCYRFKVSLIDSPGVFKFYDIPHSSCGDFLRDFFYRTEVYQGKKLEIVGLFECY